MTALHQKFEILESLDSLDQAQARDVLNYIKHLQHHAAEKNAREQRLRRQAMVEIRQALIQEKMLNHPF